VQRLVEAHARPDGYHTPEQLRLRLARRRFPAWEAVRACAAAGWALPPLSWEMRPAVVTVVPFRSADRAGRRDDGNEPVPGGVRGRAQPRALAVLAGAGVDSVELVHQAR
jgi:hypothetical protein